MEYLKQPGTKANRFDIQVGILNSAPDWSRDKTNRIPYKVKQMGIDAACIAVKNAKKKFKQTGQFNDVGFRKKRDKRDTFYVPKQAVWKNGVFKNYLGNLNPSEELGEIEHDVRVMRDGWKYYILIPKDVKVKKFDNQEELTVVSLDPGVRTFQTFYSPNGFAGKIGNKDFSRIFRLCYAMDKLVSKISKSKNSRQKYNMIKAKKRLMDKIQNLISEIHWKTIRFLVMNFQVIVIPKFNAHHMAGNLSSKVARAMLTWSHGAFRSRLKMKCEEYGRTLVEMTEEYTSKTCTNCGTINEIGSKEKWKCSTCKSMHDRDINGAKGIFLKALGDTPFLYEEISNRLQGKAVSNDC